MRRLRCSSAVRMSHAVLGGVGLRLRLRLALLPTFIVGKELQAGRLVEVLPGYVPVEHFLHAVHLPDRHLPLKVRAFVDFLGARFGTEPYWDRPEGAA
ncbi:LysR substrate-binding domain-containing protein [Aromatoleum toluclasticum]|uniref:LysR substrate-binding domain-containing protein n=1 Tax=Aromatoleum toluclasticum TaxID=92003 RepID=UPI0022B5E6EF|nr:LysR substrate-binding domain-containing protein [Aromatoleum toluclasticum]